MSLNALHNANNPYQGSYKRVLCVCSTGFLRSPTAAEVIRDRFGHNTRACGTGDYALIPLTDVLLHWADEIVCMDKRQAERVLDMMRSMGPGGKPIINLEIPDSYEFRNPELIELIEKRYTESTVEPSRTTVSRCVKALVSNINNQNKDKYMTNRKILEKADAILLEALEPYEMFPKWAEIVCHLDETFDGMSGLKKEYHVEATNDQNNPSQRPDEN